VAIAPRPRNHLNSAFRHEAFLYADEHEFLVGTASFVRDGLDAGEPVLVVVAADKIRLLREVLGDRADQAVFADMDVIGRNPGRILHAWYDFAGRHVGAGRPARGVGEPVFPERGADELVECQRHERLLNLAFDGGPAWWLMCPYDARALPGPVIDEARRSHPVLRLDGELYGNGRYQPLDPDEPFAAPLDAAPSDHREHRLTPENVPDARAFVRRNALRAGLGPGRSQDLVVAVGELVANTLQHGGGQGLLRSWCVDDGVVHEVVDTGIIEDPLVGRRLPDPDEDGGRGLWLVNQLCDLVELRWDAGGTVVRVHMRRGPAHA